MKYLLLLQSNCLGKCLLGYSISKLIQGPQSTFQAGDKAWQDCPHGIGCEDIRDTKLRGHGILIHGSGNVLQAQRLRGPEMRLCEVED